MRTRLGTFLLLTVVVAALLGGFFGGKVTAGPPLEENSQKLLKTFTEVLATIQSNYATDVSTEDLIESAIRGMLRTLDPHSSFFSSRDYDRLQEEQKGKYFGLGITIRSETPGSGRVVVVEPPVPGTPAYKAGLRAGDVIAKIEGEPIDDWDLNEEVIPNLKGPKGTSVNITVERPGEKQPLGFSVERDEIPLYTIKYAFRIRPNVGYIRITRFAETTSRELDEALEAVQEETLDGLILDLRDNPGGALSQALEVSDRFLDKGETIVSTRSRSGKEDRDYRAKKKRGYAYSMIVLINQSSASASEIVAGALQDHDRALILGETSFGKALVQTIFPLDGKRGLALTTGRYYTPSKRLIQRDYSESFWDYYNRTERVDGNSQEFFTDGGRVVYGGGGIKPDEEVELEKVSRFIRRIQRKGLFRDFTSDIHSGEVEVDIRRSFPQVEVETLSEAERQRIVSRLQISDGTLQTFRDFLAENEVEYSDEEFRDNKELIRSILRQEILLLTVGDEESYQVALEMDKQVQTAIERLPKVRTLLEPEKDGDNQFGELRQ
jgi:carboxyl-terminal processing protease